MPEVRPPWTYSLIDVVQNKSRRRTGIPAPNAVDLVGVDMSVLGGLRPHYGMKFVRQLIGEMGGIQSSSSSSSSSSGLRGATSSSSSSGEIRKFQLSGEEDLDGFFPVVFRIDAEEFGWGFVYRLNDPVSGLSRVFLEYRIGNNLTWRLKDLVGLKFYKGRQMSVQAFGMHIYIGIEGKDPFAFRYDTDTEAIIVTTDLGPGEQPVLVAFGEDITREDGDVAGQATVDTDTHEVGDPSSTDIPGNARIYMFTLCGDDAALLGATGSVAFRMEKVEDITFGSIPNAPLWVTTPEEYEGIPTFDLFRYPNGATLEGALWTEGLGPIVQKGVYTWAYQLYDTRTGRRSSLSQIVKRTPAHGAVFESGAQGNYTDQMSFPAIELVYDENKYDTVYLYRSVRSQVEGILSLDGIFTLADFRTSEQRDHTGSPVALTAPYVRAFLFYVNEDKILARKQTFLGDISADVNLPTAGSLYYFEGVMYYGKTQTFDTGIGALGTVRWSNPTDISVELVSPFNRYALKQPNEEILRFESAGANTMAFSNREVYLFRKELPFVKPFPLHGGFGIAGDRAAAPVGSMVYFVVPKGMKAIDSQGGLDDIQKLNDLFVSEWAGSVDNLSMAFDETTRVLFTLNPDLEETAVLWMDTSRISMLHDTNFKHVIEGSIPRDIEVSGSLLERRAVFADERKNVWVTDHLREKVISGASVDNGVGRQTFLDVTGDTRFTVGSVASSSSSSSISSGADNVVHFASGTVGDRVVGAKLYVLDGTNVHRKAEILEKVDSDTVLVDDASIFEVGDRVGISPVYGRWIGYQLPLITFEGFIIANDHFQQRFFGATKVSFTDVGGAAADDDTNKDARWAGLVYVGNSDTAAERSFPVETDDSKLKSVVDGPSNIGAGFGSSGHGRSGTALFPSVEIVCPDLDFRLLEVRPEGKIQSADREGFAPTRTPT